MLEMLDALALPCTVRANSELEKDAPALMDACRARGWEIAGHGRANAARQSVMGEADEVAMIADSTAVLTQACCRAPRGWLSPWIAESRVTPDLLRAAGFSYTLNWRMDDQPVWIATRAGALLSAPYPQEVSDIPAIVARKDGAAQFADMIVDTLDQMMEQARAQPLVMGVALHPCILGQPHRLRNLRRALTHSAARRERLWVTTAGEIAESFAGQVAAG